MNTLHYGDCDEIMEAMDDESVDLIYLDPPFNSDRSYNAIYKDNTGRPLPEQVEAFCDSWEMRPECMALAHRMPLLLRQAGVDEHGAEMWKAWVVGLAHTQPSLLAYLTYMTARLIRMRRLLKPTGSLYYHCDPTAGHYIKVTLDIIFNHKNFRNEIIWNYYNKYGTGKKVFGRNYDQIFFYTKTNTYTFNPQRESRDAPTRQLVRENVGGVLKNKRDADGKLMYRTVEDKKVDCVWRIPCLQHASPERLGYPTQKPVALLKRIIAASSNEGDVVLDPFCGCATTICAAHELGRRWVGVDIAFHAVRRVARARLTDTYGLVEGQDFTIQGIPRTLEGAKDLWERDAHQFARWAIESVEGFVSAKKSGDGGVDGCIYFGAPGAALSTMLLQVKGGASVGIGDLRDLHGAMHARGAEMGGLIVRDDIPERQMRNFQEYAATAGCLEAEGVAYPRLQVMTAREVLEEKRFAVPYHVSIDIVQPALPHTGRLL
jgi:site-specific DNA-methyltransferase (adenine-specific)